MRSCLVYLLIKFVLIQRVFSQDNVPPVFSSPQYVFSVSEDASVGTPLTATSPPAGVSVMTYFVRPSLSPEHFTPNHLTSVSRDSLSLYISRLHATIRN